jgi:hypothetical protein
MTIHVAITRIVRPGREAEFAQALREFFQSSFGHAGVTGAHMIMPAPDSGSREFGILRSFKDEAERDDFYSSPHFLAWDAHARTLTEGEPVYRPVHGLEAWFRAPGTAPPRWKMALATYAGVFPLATFLNLTLGPRLSGLNVIGRNAIFNGFVVVLLTWAVMPLVTRVLRGWLHQHRGASSHEP